MWLSFINSQLLLLIVPENSGSSTQVFHNQLKFRYTRFITLHYRQPVFDLGSREPYQSYPHPVSERTVLSLHCQLWLSDSVEFTCKYGQCRYITKSCSDDENNVIVKKIQCCLWISRWFSAINVIGLTIRNWFYEQQYKLHIVCRTWTLYFIN